MDSTFNTRIAMAGWLFVAVIVGSLWQTDSTYGKELIAALKDLGTGGNATVIVALPL